MACYERINGCNTCTYLYVRDSKSQVLSYLSRRDSLECTRRKSIPQPADHPVFCVFSLPPYFFRVVLLFLLFRVEETWRALPVQLPMLCDIIMTHREFGWG